MLSSCMDSIWPSFRAAPRMRHRAAARRSALASETAGRAGRAPGEAGDPARPPPPPPAACPLPPPPKAAATRSAATPAARVRPSWANPHALPSGVEGTARSRGDAMGAGRGGGVAGRRGGEESGVVGLVVAVVVAAVRGVRVGGGGGEEVAPPAPAFFFLVAAAASAFVFLGGGGAASASGSLAAGLADVDKKAGVRPGPAAREARPRAGAAPPKKYCPAEEEGEAAPALARRAAAAPTPAPPVQPAASAAAVSRASATRAAASVVARREAAGRRLRESDRREMGRVSAAGGATSLSLRSLAGGARVLRALSLPPHTSAPAHPSALARATRARPLSRLAQGGWAAIICEERKRGEQKQRRDASVCRIESAGRR